MLHEIILSLQMRANLNCKSTKDLLTSVPLLEKQFIQQLIEISDKYRIITNFMDALKKAGVGPISIGDGNVLQPGMYLNSFYNGANEVLDEYHSLLFDIEKEALRDPYLSAPTVLNRLNPILQAVDVIKQIIEKITNHEVFGTQILELCYTFGHNGTSPRAYTFKRIQKCCNKTLLMQIKSWILYGLLFDPHREFFIQKISNSGGTSISQGLYTSESSVLSKSTHSSSIDEDACQFKIEVELIPSVIPLSLARKILFIGETVRLFCRNPGEKCYDAIPVIDISKYGIDANNIISQLHAIEEMKEFHIGALEELVNEVWLPVNKHLRKLAEDVGGLAAQLKLINDIFLLGRGELFQEFLLKGSSFLDAKASTTTSRSLNFALENAAYDVYLSDNIDMLKRVSFHIPPKESLLGECKTWSVLQLSYRPPWPLYLIFTNEIMNNYNMLFIFLLQLKKAHMDITAVWADVIDIRSDRLRRASMDIRNCLLSFVTNLENYLYIDVISSELEILENLTKNTNTFSEIQKAHAIFQTNIISKAFLFPEEFSFLNELETLDKILECNKTSVFACLKGLVIMCRDFGGLIKRHHDNCNFAILIGHFKKQMDKLIRHLISLVQKINSNYSSSHLQNLILRLDYNGYFIKSASSF